MTRTAINVRCTYALYNETSINVLTEATVEQSLLL